MLGVMRIRENITPIENNYKRSHKTIFNQNPQGKKRTHLLKTYQRQVHLDLENAKQGFLERKKADATPTTSVFNNNLMQARLTRK